MSIDPIRRLHKLAPFVRLFSGPVSVMGIFEQLSVRLYFTLFPFLITNQFARPAISAALSEE
jgi:hypothetical protein